MSDGFERASTTDGQTFVYREQGSGPLVVLFHGFPDTPYGWDTIASAVVAFGYRVVTPWLRGYHPQTLVAGRGYGAVDLAGDPGRLLDALGEQSAVFVGHDWGASLVYGAASLTPDRVRAIVPIDIPHPSLLKPSPSTLWGIRHFAGFRMPWAEAMTRRDDFAYIDTLYRRWAPAWSGPERDECVRRAKECFAEPRSLTGSIAYYRGFSPRPPSEVTRRASLPALVVGGTHMLDPGLFERTASVLGAGSSALVLPGTGHWPHREAEDRFVSALIEFLGSLDAR